MAGPGAHQLCDAAHISHSLLPPVCSCTSYTAFHASAFGKLELVSSGTHCAYVVAVNPVLTPIARTQYPLFPDVERFAYTYITKETAEQVLMVDPLQYSFDIVEDIYAGDFEWKRCPP